MKSADMAEKIDFPLIEKNKQKILEFRKNKTDKNPEVFSDFICNLYSERDLP